MEGYAQYKRKDGGYKWIDCKNITNQSVCCLLQFCCSLEYVRSTDRQTLLWCITFSIIQKAFFQDSAVSSPAEQICNETSVRSFSAPALLRQSQTRVSSRIIRGIGCLFLFVELLSQIIPIILDRNYLVYSKVTPCGYTIVRYLHRQDGKK